MTRFRWDRRSGRTSAGRRRFAPGVGMLEERSLLSTLTVTNTNDSGPGSLRAEIDQAASGDTIDFAQDVRGTIALQSPLTILDKSLTIDGPGASELTVSGGGQVRDFFLDASSPEFPSVTISGLTIADGYSAGDGAGIPDDGGGILDFGVNLALNNDVFNQNTANGFGGAAYAGDGTALTINGTVFDANTAGTPDGVTGRGGAIYAAMPTTVSDSLFTNNLAQGSIASGGAIHVNVSMPLTVSSSTFTGNRVNGAFTSGGAIAGDPEATMQITASHFLSNEVDSNDGANFNGATGGAVSISMSPSSSPPEQSSITDSDFTANRAVGVVGTFGVGSAQGGAVASGGGQLIVDNVSFDDNAALGATNPTTFFGFGGSARGGGLIVTFGGTLQLSESQFVGNRAVSGAGSFAGGSASGGGLQLSPGNPSVPQSTIADSLFRGNQAIEGGAGFTSTQGGGLFDNQAPLAVTNTDFITNQAIGGAGIPGQNGTKGEGGALFGDANSVTITGGNFIANQAIGGAGGGNGGAGEGGAIANEGTMTIDGIQASGNRAIGGDAPDGTGGNGLGGGIYTNFGSVVIADSMITGNAALGGQGATDGQGFGGGLDVAGGGATVTTSKIVGNHASTAGDNIYGTTTG